MLQAKQNLVDRMKELTRKQTENALLLRQISDLEQKILKLRFGLEGAEPLTLAEIGRTINVSRERVRQLEAKAIMKLRLMSSYQQAA